MFKRSIPALVLSYIALTFAVPIAYDSSELSNPSTNSQNENISEFTVHLKKELVSLLLSDPDQAQNYQPDHDIFVIPRSHITERTLNSLGYKDLVKYAKKFRYANTLFKSHLDILVPEKTIPYFVFNTSDPLNMPTSQSRLMYANFIDSSAPFTLPGLSTLVDYLLILPIPSNGAFDPDSLNPNILTTKSNSLPMFAHAVRDGVPLIVFLFKSGTETASSKEVSIPLMGPRTIVTDHELNVFFDEFAKTWVQDINMSQLIHGVFCTLNVKSTSQSFCIKIKDDLTNLLLFPAYDRSTSNVKRGLFDQAISSSEIPNKRVLLQKRTDHVNGKVISRANHNTQLAPLEELTIPLSIVKENRANLEDQGYSPRRRKYSSSQYGKDIQHDKLSRREASNTTAVENDERDDELAKTKIEEIRNRLEDRLHQKKIKDRNIRGSSDTYIQTKLGKVRHGSHKQKSSDIGAPKWSNIKVKPSQRKIKFTESHVASDGEDVAHEWNEKLRRERQSRQKLVKLQSSISRNNHKNVSGSGSESESGSGSGPVTGQQNGGCEPITWFNVFHHSVFGKTKFCGV